jgi:uncharacterized protein YbjT (DUF2867 family)
MTSTARPFAPVLVLGGTGTVGRRVVAHLERAGVAVRAAGRHTQPPFDWTAPASWQDVLAGTERLFLLLPDETALPVGFLDRAAAAGVRRIVLLSDRAVDVMGVTRLQEAERAVRASVLDWTILRCDWFDQDFETFLRDGVLAGHLRLPVGDARQGFVDADDIAAVSAALLTTDDRLGRVLELTGPEMLSFRDAVDTIGAVLGRTVTFDGTAVGYREQMMDAGLPREVLDDLVDAFAALEARGDTAPTGTVEDVLGRPARSFAEYAADAATRGVWDRPAE